MTNEAQRIFSEGPEGSTLRCRTCGLWKPTRRFANPSVCKACTPESEPTKDRTMATAQVAVGTRVRQRPIHGFLLPADPTGTVLGTGDAPDLVRIRLDRPARCSFEEDAPHDILEYSTAPSTLDVLPPA